ncbi:hypothetical protein SAMN05444287_2938 [Octadecabacter temperatus]|uniref:Uncharacterized protein n=1 Tax=Octadecabacter temperatus TaxID=1458307 RepID=A0A0K0Y8X6_9RHOB|nr:hypothetical protein [Octadecabacter temperatus]AKS47418.1 hypothetical protein OSB_28950 [Octadecabacter temperatus]SIO42904.1 hypothetical protein SAMN05444287_2938 [Octadecabacter temperatus]
MMNGIQSKTFGTIAIGSGAIAASIYLVMINVTLAHVHAVSGHVPFDMRPIGYGPADAVTLLDALGVEGRHYYLTRQLALDTLYPATLALTLVATICWFAQRFSHSILARAAIAVSVGSALFDYIENLGIAVMLWVGPDVSATLINATSVATIVKSALTTLAVLLVIVVGLVWARQTKPVMP